MAAGFWGAPVAGGDAATVDGRHRLARVRNRSKFRRGGHEARWLSRTPTGLPAPVCRRSKIRLVRSRDRGFLAGKVSIRIFGADHFPPLAQRAPISYDRRPGRREDAFIFHRELELQPLALIGGVARKA